MPATTAAPIYLVHEDTVISVTDMVHLVGNEVRQFGYSHPPGTYRFVVRTCTYLTIEEFEAFEKELNDPEGIQKHLDATVEVVQCDQRDDDASGHDVVVVITTTHAPIFPAYT